MTERSVFLASSNELATERKKLQALINRFNNAHVAEGFFLRLLMWEGFDAAFAKGRKQEEYNAHVLKSDLFLAVFRRRAGEYTVEELDVALEGWASRGRPDVYLFIEVSPEGERLTPEVEALEAAYGARDGVRLRHYRETAELLSAVGALLTELKGE